MNSAKIKIIIENIVFWFIFIIAVAVALWYIFGHSPSFEQSLITLLLGYFIKSSARNEMRFAKFGERLARIEEKLK